MTALLGLFIGPFCTGMFGLGGGIVHLIGHGCMFGLDELWFDGAMLHFLVSYLGFAFMDYVGGLYKGPILRGPEPYGSIWRHRDD